MSKFRITLIVILIIRLIMLLIIYPFAQLIGYPKIFATSKLSISYSFLFIEAVYLIMLFGVLKKQKWGYIMTIIFSIFSIMNPIAPLLNHSSPSSSEVIGVVVNLLIIFLAYKEYQNIGSTTTNVN